MKTRNFIHYLLMGFSLSFILVSFSAEARSGGQFLRSGIGAEARGLGLAYNAIVDDPTAVYWNPAGLANINGRRGPEMSREVEEAFSTGDFDELLDETSKERETPPKKAEGQPTFAMQVETSASVFSGGRINAFAGTGFTALGGTLGVGVLGSQVGQIPGFSTTAASSGSLSYNSLAAFLGYGFSQGFNRVGVSLMGMQEGVAAKKTMGGGLSVGIQSTPIPIVSIGADIQNLVGVVQVSPDRPNSWQKLDSILRVSIAVSTPPPASSLKLLLGFSSNLDDPTLEGFHPNIGVAYAITRNIYSLIGFDNGRFSLGLNMNFGWLELTYAVNQDDRGTGFQHFADLNVHF